MINVIAIIELITITPIRRAPLNGGAGIFAGSAEFSDITLLILKLGATLRLGHKGGSHS